MDRRLMRGMAVIGGIVLAVTGGGIMTARAQDGGVLRFGTYGGTMLEGQKVYLGEPFEALTGAKVQWTAATEEVFANKLIAAAGRSPPYDVVLLDDPWYSLVRVRGLAAKLDPAKVPNLKNVEKLFRMPDDMGSCLFSFTSGIIYNKNKFTELGLPAPTRWQDLANPKLSGHVGTQTLAATPVKYFLAAYAIQLGDPPTKWDRAIDEMAKIKFHSFSSGIADLMAKIEAGDVWAAPIVGSRAYALIEKGLPVDYVLPDNGNGTKGGVSCTAIVVPKGSANPALGEKMLNFTLSSDAQLMQATAVSAYGPVIGALDPILEKAPKIADRIPWGKVVANGFRLSWDREADLDKFSEYVDAWNRKVQK